MNEQKLVEFVRLTLTDWGIASYSLRFHKRRQTEAALASLGDVLGELAQRIEQAGMGQPHSADAGGCVDECAGGPFPHIGSS